jgi:hypothetical protein
MRRSGWLLAALAITGQAQAAETQAPLDLAPQSQWVMDYDSESCALRRLFGTPENEALLEVRQYAPGDSFDVIVASSTIPRTNQSPQVRFEPDAKSWEPSSVILGEFGESMKGVIFTDSLWPNSRAPDEGEAPAPWSAADRKAREDEVTGLLVEKSFGRDLRLQTGAMHAPMEAMRACLDDLLGTWGIDVAAHKTLSRPLAPRNYDSFVHQLLERYPQSMIQMRRSAYVRVRLIVGPDGEPSSCKVQLEVRDPVFQQVACDTLMRYARFDPALDADGNTIASFYTTTIQYRVSGG